ncbi:MAG: glutamine synthetase III [Clostridia bacterium]|nr:glutamine synthetase III [Clostridia bacterium]
MDNNQLRTQNIPELFGSLVFNDEVMKERLPKEAYRALHKTVEEGRELDLTLANVIAHAMKDWALEKGATHYTHWFQPMTEITAEKHDSFIRAMPGGKVIMEFSGKELIKGEPDASSFPSGGIRATFEARGYTAWDPTSYAFIKDDSLCIPTAFCSYTGEVLDKKTPLLRSMEELSKQAVRALNLIGADITRVIPTVGAEQEYFLIDRDMYRRRRDLLLTGRTLFGAKPPKGQELDDHYFGVIKTRVLAFMQDLNVELWKVGVLAKTEHNEAAPAQHELAPIYTTTNVATDQNQLTMELMKKVAHRHNLHCCLHEKPFEGVNGSGKHNNWSIADEKGNNLLEPGENPRENRIFMLLLAAVIKAADDYQDLLRISVASAGNDHRLGANEAPPAVVSVFLGSDLTAVVESVINHNKLNAAEDMKLRTGVEVLPDFAKDGTDRNRTSPFAFTGNKFEFRMPGSACSVAGPNIVLNTIVAESLSLFADEMESAGDRLACADEIIARELKAHTRIIFNGNSYDDEWVRESERRGLLNLKTTADALPHYTDEKNLRLFEKHNIFTAKEVESRRDILLDTYAKKINIEALTMVDMAKRDVLPAAIACEKTVAEAQLAKSGLGLAGAGDAEAKLIKKLSALISEVYDSTEALDKATLRSKDMQTPLSAAQFTRDSILPAMERLRSAADALEVEIGSQYLPYPTYTDLLFKV